MLQMRSYEFHIPYLPEYPCHGSGLAMWRPRFDPIPVHVRFMVDIVILGQVFLKVLQFFVVSIIPPMAHIHSYITNAARSWQLTVSLRTHMYPNIRQELFSNLSSEEWGLAWLSCIKLNKFCVDIFQKI